MKRLVPPWPHMRNAWSRPITLAQVWCPLSSCRQKKRNGKLKSGKGYEGGAKCCGSLSKHWKGTQTMNISLLSNEYRTARSRRTKAHRRDKRSKARRVKKWRSSGFSLRLPIRRTWQEGSVLSLSPNAKIFHNLFTHVANNKTANTRLHDRQHFLWNYAWPGNDQERPILRQIHHTRTPPPLRNRPHDSPTATTCGSATESGA